MYITCTRTYDKKFNFKKIYTHTEHFSNASLRVLVINLKQFIFLLFAELIYISVFYFLSYLHHASPNSYMFHKQGIANDFSTLEQYAMWQWTDFCAPIRSITSSLVVLGSVLKSFSTPKAWLIHFRGMTSPLPSYVFQRLPACGSQCINWICFRLFNSELGSFEALECHLEILCQRCDQLWYMRRLETFCLIRKRRPWW
jgi:hypothetical protein